LTGLVSDRASSSAAEAALKEADGAGQLAAALHGLAAALTAREALVHAAQFTGALLLILVAHELGHFIAARIHKVDASLPYFLPLPLLSPFGTMGAVIRMRGTIPTRAALLDIGASGPLAGLVFAIPLYFWGAAHSHLVAMGSPEAGVELGESLALRLLDHLAMPNVPNGFELELSPVAFAAWAGMLVTMINLLPVAQLDGGHVAYALFGPRQNRYGQIVHRSMLVFFFVSVVGYLVRDVRAGLGLYRIGAHVGNSLFWLVWFEVLGILGSISRPLGQGIPPTPRASAPTPEPGALTIRTRLFAILGLLFLASYGRDHSTVTLWLAWFAGLALLLAMEVKGGTLRPNALLDHPPTGEARLGFVRAAIAVLTLVIFALLFMPTPITM
jgi:membrane-associated protease RseP (regulator of RpoE activity)